MTQESLGKGILLYQQLKDTQRTKSFLGDTADLEFAAQAFEQFIRTLPVQEMPSDLKKECDEIVVKIKNFFSLRVESLEKAIADL